MREPLRFLPVASPVYLAERGTPSHLRDMLAHRCVRTPFPRGERHLWDPALAGEEHAIEVPGSLTLDRMAPMIEASARAMELAFVSEQAVAQQVADGRPVPLLRNGCPADDRFVLYSPGRRHVPAPLRAFVDHLKAGDRPPLEGSPGPVWHAAKGWPSTRKSYFMIDERLFMPIFHPKPVGPLSTRICRSRNGSYSPSAVEKIRS